MANSEKFHYLAEVPNCEIRKVDQINDSFEVEEKDGSKKTVPIEYLYLTCDVGENMERAFFKDKDMGNKDKYKRGMVGTLTIRIDVTTGFKGKTDITVVDFKENED